MKEPIKVDLTPAPARPDSVVATLQAQIDQAKAAQAAQDAQEAERQRLAEEAAASAREAVAQREREAAFRLDQVDKAKAQRVPTGYVMTSRADLGGELSTAWLMEQFALVIRGSGPLELPVINVNGGCATMAPGPTLEVVTFTSQRVLAAHAEIYKAFYLLQADLEFRRLVLKEQVRNPGASVLFMAAPPSARIVKDEHVPGLVRIIGEYGQCFAYELPELGRAE